MPPLFGIGRLPIISGTLFFAVLMVFGLTFMLTGCAGQPAKDGESARDKSRLYYVLKDGKWGYMDGTGTMIIEPRFDSPPDLSELLPSLGMPSHAYIISGSTVTIFAAAQEDDDAKQAVARLEAYDILGRHYDLVTKELIVNRRLRSIGPFKDDRAAVYKDGRWGFIDKTGQVVISPQYNFVQNFSEGRAAVWQQDKGWFFIDKDGVVVGTDIFENADSFSEGLARVQSGGKWGFVNPEGVWAIQPTLEFAGNFQEGHALFKMNGKSGIMDKAGNLTAPPEHYRITSLSEGLSAFQTPKGWWGYMDNYGTPVIQPQFEDGGFFHEGLAPVRKGQFYGFIDKYGKMVIEPQYTFTFEFSEGLAPVKKDGYWGFIDKTGKMVIPANFEWAYPFREGLAAVEMDGKWGYIDKTGTYVWEPTN